MLEEFGWKFRCCYVWDKGIGHIAGNANTKTLRSFPLVTEICVQYVRDVKINALSLKEWLRAEWQRSGLPLYKANEACGVRNAATRKYLTQCDLWYFPPPSAFEAMALYANRYGNPVGRPYFSLDGIQPCSGEKREQMRAKFHCDVGITNVWQEPAVRGRERLKEAYKCLHMNQKPLSLIERSILASSDPGDVVWEPFGGLCSAAVSSIDHGRQCYSSEILDEYYEMAVERIRQHARA